MGDMADDLLDCIDRLYNSTGYDDPGAFRGKKSTVICKYCGKAGVWKQTQYGWRIHINDKIHLCKNSEDNKLDKISEKNYEDSKKILENCPFCLSYDLNCEGDAFKPENVFIACKTCGCRGPISSSNKEAESKWNRNTRY